MDWIRILESIFPARPEPESSQGLISRGALMGLVDPDPSRRKLAASSLKKYAMETRFAIYFTALLLTIRVLSCELDHTAP